jgi:hypothetical protein
LLLLLRRENRRRFREACFVARRNEARDLPVGKGERCASHAGAKTAERKERDTMQDVLKRDITGECEGDCRNTVRESEARRQVEIKNSGVAAPEEYPSVEGAFSRNEAPGFLGGHV